MTLWEDVVLHLSGLHFLIFMRGSWETTFGQCVYAPVKSSMQSERT